MTAEKLREAAALMRSRANAASCLEDGTPDHWFAESVDDKTSSVCVTIGGLTGDVIDPTETASAEHIASWHPAVALAVADWLEATARELDSLGDPDLSAHPQDGRRTAALAVATAYLGVPQ